jgi:hypothetical protein
VSENELVRLVAKDAIHTALNDYTLGMDLRNLDRFLGAWHPDGVWEITSAVGGAPLYAKGREQLVAAVKALWGMEQFVLHITANHEVTILDEGNAVGDGHACIYGVNARGVFFLNACVYPADRYAQYGERWVIAYRRVEVNVYVELPPEIAPLTLSVGFGGAFGPSS